MSNFRKCKFKKRVSVTNPGGNISYETIEIIGYFHKWGKDIEESGQSVTVGVVETLVKSVELVYPEFITFLDDIK